MLGLYSSLILYEVLCSTDLEPSISQLVHAASEVSVMDRLLWVRVRKDTSK